MNEGLTNRIIQIVEKQQTAAKDKKYGDRVLSGYPDDVYGFCGEAGSVSVAQELSERTGRNIVKAKSEDNDSNGHVYLWDSDTDEIIDPSAGQFIPESSRIGFEGFFTGNCFIGPRNVLKEICSKGVIHTSTASDPEKSFRRIWGEKGRGWLR